MLTFDRKLPEGTPATATLTLSCDARRRSRLKVTLDSGEEAGVLLAWGESLRHGDLIASSEGHVVRVVAADEPVLVIRCRLPSELARVAYHLGNRHVAVEVGEDTLKIAPDHVLRAMVEGLGATVEEARLPFEPEAGAYGSHGHAPHDRPGRLVGGRQVS